MVISPYSLGASSFLLRQSKEVWEAKDQLVFYLVTVWYFFPGSFYGLWTLLVVAPSVPLVPRDIRTTLRLAGALGLEVLAILGIWRRFLRRRSKLPAPWNSVDVDWVFRSSRTLRYTPIYGLQFLLSQYGANRYQVRRRTPWHFRHSLNLAWAVMILFGWVKFFGIDALLLCGMLQLYLATVGLLVGQLEASIKECHGKEPPRLDYRHKPRYALAAVSQALLYALTFFFGGARNIWAIMIWLAMPPVTLGTLVMYMEHAHEAEYVNTTGVTHGGHDETFCHVCRATIITRDVIGEHVHHPTLASLVSSARSGCRICAAVWQAASHIHRDFVRDLMSWRPATTYCSRQVELNGTRISFEVRSGRGIKFAPPYVTKANSL